MAPVPEWQGHRYRVTIPNRRLAPRRFRHLLSHLQAPSCFSHEQNPSCQHPREEVLKYLNSENWRLSMRPPPSRRSFDSDRYQILPYSYLPCLILLLSSKLLLRFDVQFAGDLAVSADFSSLGFNRFLLVLRLHRPLERYLTALRNDLDVVCICGERLVFHDGLTNLLRDVAIRTIVLLLICGGLVLIPIPFVDLGVVWSSWLSCGFLRKCERSTAEQQTGAQKITNSGSVKCFHRYFLLNENLERSKAFDCSRTLRERKSFRESESSNGLGLPDHRHTIWRSELPCHGHPR